MKLQSAQLKVMTSSKWKMATSIYPEVWQLLCRRENFCASAHFSFKTGIQQANLQANLGGLLVYLREAVLRLTTEIRKFAAPFTSD